MSYQDILYAVEGGIATITLNRPDRLNAWTPTMETEVRQAMLEARDDAAVRVIVLTGAGRGFCAGADFEVLKNVSAAEMRRRQALPPHDMNRRGDWQTRYGYFPSVGKPILGMINGACAGLGMVMALYCDLRFAADSAAFSTAFARRGLVAEHGISWMLPHIVGHANAMDLLLSARKIKADEALAMGLVNKVYPTDQLKTAVMAYAQELATQVSPRSMGVIKRQLYEVPFQTLADATILANHETDLSLGSEDFKEGVAHYIEKRAPQFSGR